VIADTWPDVSGPMERHLGVIAAWRKLNERLRAGFGSQFAPAWTPVGPRGHAIALNPETGRLR
jgi:hypothetical protein